jgi:type I restriction enzyme S subunit
VSAEEWRECKLGDLLEIRHGYAFKGEFFGTTGTHIVLTPGNFFDEGGFKSKGSDEKWYSGPVPSDYVLNEGDIIVAMTEQAEGLLGSSAIVPRGGLYLHNQRIGLVKLKPEASCDPRYISYLFNTRSVRQQIRASASGAKIRHTAPSRIAEVAVTIPPIAEQRHISGLLSGYDELIDNNLRRIRILEEMARSIYREWFVRFRFPGYESVDRVMSPLGMIPKGFDVRVSSQIATYLNGYAFKPGDWGSLGKPIIKIRELKSGISSDTPRNTGESIPQKFVVSDGDVLFSWSADLDVYLWSGGEGLLNQHLFNVIPIKGLSRVFCFHALKEVMPQFRALSLGATMHHIKRSALDQVMLTVPPTELRSCFDDIVEPIHSLALTLRRAVLNLRATRDLLLPRLISGRLSLAQTEAAI